MTNECAGSYCEKIEEFEGQGPDLIRADAKYTEYNDERVKTLEQLGGLTTLAECDNSKAWFLRWWLARYDFQTAVRITNECINRSIDFSRLSSTRDYHLLERSLESIYGPLAEYAYMLRGD